jgi:hypothetical protein
MATLVDLIRAIAWPATVLIALAVLRSQIQAFIIKLTDSISQAAQISVTKRGVEIKLEKKMAAVSTQITALNAVQEQVKESLYAAPRTRRRRSQMAGVKADGKSEIPERLYELAKTYLSINLPDWRQRVARKNELALEMGDIIIREQVSRDRLAAATDEGLQVALASAIATDPEEGDLDRILHVVPMLSRLHVRFKFVVALISMLNKGLIRDTDFDKVHETLRGMSVSADEGLQKIISDAEGLLEAIKAGDVRPLVA